MGREPPEQRSSTLVGEEDLAPGDLTGKLQLCGSNSDPGIGPGDGKRIRAAHGTKATEHMFLESGPMHKANAIEVGF